MKPDVLLRESSVAGNGGSAHSLMGRVPLEPEFQGLSALRSVLGRLLHAAARYLPMFPAWRVAIHRFRGVNIGRGVFIGSEVFIDNTYPGLIRIGDDVTVISRSFIIGHTFTPSHLEGVISSPANGGVVLGKGCYIGAGCTILPGVTVGECAVVGASSLICDDIPAYSVAVGNPARVTRLFEKDEVVL